MIQNSCLITIYHHQNWVKPVTGLAYLPGNYSSMKEKEKEKSTCIDFQTDVETSLNRHIQLVESDKSLIFFNCNLCNMEFSNSDELIGIQMKRHEEWHDGKKSNQHASQNKTWGKVVWKKLLVGETE